ncbi:MAG TPA: D-alanyl-D-alanine carboxypeptidase family protein [Steroidobacteraceae bacterium]|nr:D-alanyl-D-alanine carboxypeptidase family protein [Steroidobacteraceae bacterium]
MKRFLTCLLLALVPAAALAGAPAVIPPPPQIGAHGYILIDHESGRVLAEQRADERMEPASITKVMTAYIVFEALQEKRLALTDKVRVSEYAWRTGGAVTDGSTSFLELNSEVAVEDLIKGMIVQSGNDATIVLAEKVGGTESGFVTIMNEYARRLGMKGTRFTNSWGNPAPEHYTTARDLATLARALIREFPDYYKWYSLREFTWNNHRQSNRNGLLGRDPSVDGIKTGHTNSAKYCLMTSASRNGMRLISVVLGAPSIRGREDASATLLNYGYTFFETVKVHDASQPLLTPQVFKGSALTVPVGIRAPISVTIARGAADSITKETTVNSPLIAPIAAGATVGQYTVRVGDEVVTRVPLVALEAVDEGGIWRWAVDSVKLWFED